MKKTLSWLLLGALILSTMCTLLACGANQEDKTDETQEQPTVNETDKETEEEDPMNYVTLTKKGASLYDATYKTMTDRLQPDGYAPTSITGAYGGMFVRDASIQVMSHIANGDLDAAASILRYMASFHVAIGAEHAIHVMNDLQPNAYYDYRGDNGKPITEVSSLETSIPLYKINAPTNRAAQSFSVPFDSISEIQVYLAVPQSNGQIVLTLGEEPDDDSYGRVSVSAKDLGNGFASFKFDEPVEVTPNDTYFFTVQAIDCSGNVVASGATGTKTFPSQNYDKPTLGGWAKTNNTIGFKVLSANVSADGTPVGADIAHAEANNLVTCLDDRANGNHVTTVELWLGRTDDAHNNEFVTVGLYADDKLVGTQKVKMSDLSLKKPTSVKCMFPLPLFKITKETNYEVRVTPDTRGSVIWYGKDADHLSYNFGTSNVRPASERIQVDGNYMFVNAYAMFALAAKDTYGDFIEDMYPIMDAYARYFVANEKDYMHENNLLRNPCYEHSRDGRYWDCYDLITNCFASEALHKMAMVAEQLGKNDDKSYFNQHADRISDGIKNNLTCEMEGKKIYTEMIALDENSRLIKGFSFVSLAPVAADWYAMDDELMANTYEMYRKHGTENYGKYEMLTVTVNLDENDKTISKGNHVITKGLAWEMLYLWKTGNTERLNQMVAFIDAKSDKTYPETWLNNGGRSDSANQEHANWLLFEMARITGKYKN